MVEEGVTTVVRFSMEEVEKVAVGGMQGMPALAWPCFQRGKLEENRECELVDANRKFAVVFAAELKD